jgi:hypothetical protein
MKLIISKQHIKGQLKKFGYNDAEEGVHNLINNYHRSFVRHLLDKRRTYQKGGRVSMPLEYFGGNTSSYSSSPTYSDISPTNSLLRPSIVLNDPSGVLATPKALQGLVGGATPCFQVTKSACKNALEQLDIDTQGIDKHRLVEDTKQKFEKLMTKALKNAKRSSKSSTLKESDLSAVLNLQSYKNFKL